MVATRY